MQKKFDINQKVTVFDFAATITEVIDITREPHLYGVTFDETGKQHIIEAAHIEAVRDNRPVTERIKTFEDALNALSDDNVLVRQFKLYEAQMNGEEDDMNDLTAYIKLRIITAALNDGWQPTFSDDEVRYYPWFCLYTESEYNDLDDEDKERCCRVVGRSGYNAYASGGLVCASANYASSSSLAGSGSRLAFRSRELALYAGKQFIEIWCDFIF